MNVYAGYQGYLPVIFFSDLLYKAYADVLYCRRRLSPIPLKWKTRRGGRKQKQVSIGGCLSVLLPDPTMWGMRERN